MKRETLERNLKRVISRIEAGIPPFRITEIFVFGSFLRMKEEPKDVDLLMFYRTDPEYDKEVKRFKYYIFGLLKTEDGLTILEHIASNHKVTLALLKDMFPGLRVDLWAKYIKATGSMKQYYSYTFNPMNISKKVLREGMRGIQISEILHIDDKYSQLSCMPTKSFKLIWAEDNPEVDKNLLQTPEEKVAIVLEEIENFMLQVEQWKSYYYVLSNVSKWVIEKIRVHNIVPDEEQVTKQAKLVGNERGILEPYLKWILNWGVYAKTGFDAPRYNEKATHLDIESEVAKIEVSVKDISELGVLCESMRSDIRVFQSRCAFARGLLRRLIDKDRYYHISIEEWIARCAMWALDGVPLNEATDDVKRWVLSDLGLDKISENIVLVVSKRGGATYCLAESDEELQELTDQSIKGKMERKYAKYIKAIIRKAFPKNTEVDVDFYSVIGEYGLAVPQKIYLEAATREDDHTNFLNVVKNSAFVISDSYLAARKAQWDTNYIEAILELDISQLNGDRKLIKKLIESKLTLSPEILSF